MTNKYDGDLQATVFDPSVPSWETSEFLRVTPPTFALAWVWVSPTPAGAAVLEDIGDEVRGHNFDGGWSDDLLAGFSGELMSRASAPDGRIAVVVGVWFSV